MANESKIQNLTDIYNPQSCADEIKCGIIALENDKYMQAYNHLYKVYKTQRLKKSLKGQACYYLAEILRKCDDSFIDEIKETNEEILNYYKTKKEANNRDARKFLCRKYLLEGAYLEDPKAIAEYGLNCIRLGKKDAFLFDSTDANREAALAWARKMYQLDNREAKVAAYIIYAKYYLYQSTLLASNHNLISFCENTINAHELNDSDQRACYFMGIMCGDERIKQTKYADYFNQEESFQYFKDAIECLEENDYVDPAIKEGTQKYIDLYKKHFPNMR